MTKISEYKFDSKNALFQQLLRDVMDELSHGLKNRPQASMLLSGGTSPGRLFDLMSEQIFDWQKVWFGLSDERWLSPGHADSNEKLVRDRLLTNRVAHAGFIGIKSMADDVVTGQEMSDRQLRALPRPFDITLLGMGLDGHTASLFPDSPDLAAALDENTDMLCAPIRRGGDEIPRMTMTLKALLGSREIKLLIFGTEKWQVYQQARQEKTMQQPISHILHQTKTPVSVYWAA